MTSKKYISYSLRFSVYCYMGRQMPITVTIFLGKKKRERNWKFSRYITIFFTLLYFLCKKKICGTCSKAASSCLWARFFDFFCLNFWHFASCFNNSSGLGQSVPQDAHTRNESDRFLLQKKLYIFSGVNFFAHRVNFQFRFDV